MAEGLHDARRTYTFHMDDAVLDVFGPRVGAYGIAVYALLARHASKKAAFPSYTHMSHQLGVSRQTIWRTLALLVKEGLIHIETRDAKHAYHESNLYTLLDLSAHHTHPLTPDTGGRSSQELPGSSQELPGSSQELEGKDPDPEKGQDLKDPEPPIIPLPASQQLPRLQADAKAVLTHLVQVTGRPFREPGEIAGCLKRGATVPECLLVIDWWRAVKTVEDPEQDKYFTPQTPFRATKFDTYRGLAVQWDLAGRPSPRASPLSRSQQRALENYEATLDLEGMINGTHRRQDIRHEPGSARSDLQRGAHPPKKTRLLDSPRGLAP